MKKLALAVASLTAAAAPAFGMESFNDRARVLNVHPIHERIPVAREECWNEVQRGYEERRVTRSDTGAAIGPATVLGAVIGGVVGHQFGNSSGGRDRGTAAGAIVGGVVGNQVDRENRGAPPAVGEVERIPVERNVERCRTVNEVREATVGYDVRYEYLGRQFTTRLDRDPGRNLRVNVTLAPVEGAELAPPAGRPGPHPGAPAYR
jgi:uncharacterized protein YcfJ